MLLTWRNETFVPGLTASIQGLPNSVRRAGSSPQNPEVGFFWIKFRAAFQTEPRFPVKLVKDYSVSASNMSKCHQSERGRKGGNVIVLTQAREASCRFVFNLISNPSRSHPDRYFRAGTIAAHQPPPNPAAPCPERRLLMQSSCYTNYYSPPHPSTGEVLGGDGPH